MNFENGAPEKNFWVSPHYASVAVSAFRLPLKAFLNVRRNYGRKRKSRYCAQAHRMQREGGDVPGILEPSAFKRIQRGNGGRNQPRIVGSPVPDRLESGCLFEQWQEFLRWSRPRRLYGRSLISVDRID